MTLIKSLAHHAITLQRACAYMMNRRTIFIIALIFVLLLHFGVGIIMLHDERNRIQAYLEEPSTVVIQLIPEEEAPVSMPEPEILVEAPVSEDIERTEKEESPPPQEETTDRTETEEEATSSEEASTTDEKVEDLSEKRDQEASYQQNISRGGDLMQEDILPPKEDGGYSRKVSTDKDPYQKLVEDAIALLEETPFLDKEWKDQPADEEETIYYSQEFIELLKKYNPTEPIHKEEIPEPEESLVPEEAQLGEFDHLGNPKPVTLIVNRIQPPINLAEIERQAEKKEIEKERAHHTNIINTAGNQIRRQEYNVALASSRCYNTYIKGSNRRYSAIVMIFENPKGTGIYQSTGNLQLDNCIIEMTNQFIQIPAEMERIRKNAPRMKDGKGYLLNASF